MFVNFLDIFQKQNCKAFCRLRDTRGIKQWWIAAREVWAEKLQSLLL